MIEKIQNIIERYNNKSMLMNILLDIQQEYGFIPDEAIKEIGKKLEISRVDIEQTISFYHFFSVKPMGKYSIYLNDSVVACMMGSKEVAKAFEEAAGCKFGETTKDGLIGLHSTACIGMNDQEPAALINGIPFTKLTPAKAKDLIENFKAGKKVEELVYPLGDGANNSAYLKSMVNNNLRKKGPVLFAEYTSGNALRKLTSMSAVQVINEVKASNIRGRGGAGFPTGLKWEFCSKFEAKDRYVICNADEGEPGTFKDRVLLTELPYLLFEGMTIGGYAIGAKEGILYLRNEYRYLKAHLEKTLEGLRNNNLLGKNIAGKTGFDFDIRIQFGAGAYICGEESALIESAEGKRGEPRNRPPFPVQSGYMHQPTIVNNVETLCSVVKIIEKGADWYKSFGTKNSSGTKLLSISGDCKYPGVYEIEWGMTVKNMLEMVGAENTMAVQAAGPSGRCIGQKEFDRIIANEDLPTGGAMIVIGKNRNILKDVVLNFTNFFIDESCGSCVPCRAMTTILKQKLEDILHGKGTQQDIENMVKWGKMMKDLNRCGLGQTAANPILTSIENFREEYNKLIKEENGMFYEFDMMAAVKDSCDYVGRIPNVN